MTLRMPGMGVGLVAGFEGETGDEMGGGGGSGAEGAAEGLGGLENGAEGQSADEGSEGSEGNSEGQEGVEGEGAEGVESEGNGARAGKNGNTAQARFQQLANENRAFKQQLATMQQQLQQARTPIEEQQAQARQKELAKKFYGDPAGYVEAMRKELEGKFKETVSEQRDLARYESEVQSLKASPAWSDELNVAMVKVLNRYGLTTKEAIRTFGGNSKALRLAYETATGKEWGTWAKDGYNTRIQKERLSRPGSGGGNSRGAAAMAPDQYEAAMTDLAHRVMDPDEQSREVQKLNARLDAFYASQQG